MKLDGIVLGTNVAEILTKSVEEGFIFTKETEHCASRHRPEVSGERYKSNSKKSEGNERAWVSVGSTY